MLRGICHLQLYELPAQLPSYGASGPGCIRRNKAPGQTPAPRLLSLSMENGNVSEMSVSVKYLDNLFLRVHLALNFALPKVVSVSNFRLLCVHFVCIFCCCSQFVERCKHGVMQYTVMRPLTTFIALWVQWDLNLFRTTQIQCCAKFVSTFAL